MALSDLKLPEELIEFTGGSFTVRGLGLDDVTYLIRKHSALLEKVFDKVAEQKEKDLDDGALAGFALDLVETAPGVVADVIACGAGEPKAAEIALRLPVAVQLDALEKIGTFTFVASGGPKKFLETVVRLTRGVNGLLDKPQVAPKA